MDFVPARTSLEVASLFDVEFLPNHWSDPQALLESAQRYRQFRLLSLQLAPDSYASTFEQEVLFTNDVWLQRLENPKVKHVMAIARREGPTKKLFSAIDSVWIGMIVVHEKQTSEFVGPSVSPWTSNLHQTSDDSEKAEDGHSDLFYQLNGLFVHPVARRTGLGKKLVYEALAYIQGSIEQRVKAASITLFVDAWNKAAIGLYSSCGFDKEKEYEYQIGDSSRQAIKMSQTIRNDDRTINDKLYGL